MSKHIEFLEKIGIEDVSVFEQDDFNVDEFAETFRKSQIEALRGSKEFVEPLRNDFKKAGLGEAYLKAKKSLNKTFSLGKSNSELEAIDYEDLLVIVSEAANKGKVTEDVVKEREKIIADLQEALAAKENEAKDIITRYETEKKQAKKEAIIKAELDKHDFAFSKDNLYKLLTVKMMESRIDIDFDGDKVLLKEGDYNYMPNGKMIGVGDYVKTELSEFIVKNNGQQPPQQQIVATQNDRLKALYPNGHLLSEI